MNNERTYTHLVKQAMKVELNAISELVKHDLMDYESVCRKIAECEGKIVFMGVGKSGHIGKKLAATFASTGTPSFFVHATEGVHGDLGMIEARDITILISNSGSTKEVLDTLPTLSQIGCVTIAFTSNGESELAKRCDFQILYPKQNEADHLQLAPTSSSTMTLVLGDAIACAVSEAKQFTKEAFHKYHPAGALGKKLREEAAR